MKKIAVIGAGISGLTTAWSLMRRGIGVELFEASATAGGVIQSHRQEGFLLESGPNSVLAGGEVWEEMMSALGLEDELLQANPESNRRFIVRGGRLVALPSSPGQFLSSPFLSLQGKCRLMAEPFVPGFPITGETSVAEYFEKRLGREALDYLINPFVSGVYAGRPEQLSLTQSFPFLAEAHQRSHSLVLGLLKGGKKKKKRARKQLVSFRGGLGVLTSRLAEQLAHRFRPGMAVDAIVRTADGFSVAAGAVKCGGFTEVVLTQPLAQLEKLRTEGFSLAGLAPLREVPYAPVRVWHLGFRRETVRHALDGFGFLVPECEGSGILGGLFSSTLFPGRAPEGSVLLTVFAGGLRNPELMNLEKAVLRRVVLGELDRFLGVDGEPVFESETVWPAAIPQMVPGYDRYLQVMEDFEKATPGVHLAGNFRGGVSVLNCMESGLKLGGALPG